jgi:tetratricopeptide (TPR) repeat protein
MSAEDRRQRAFKLLQRGTRLLHQNKAREAARLLERARSLGLENADLALNLGGAYVLTGRFKQAVPLLEEARDQEPDNAMIWMNLGAAYLGNPVLAKEEDQVRAIAAFERALAIDPVAPNAAYNIALIYRDRRMLPEAQRWLRRALQTNPLDADARRILERLENGAAR